MAVKLALLTSSQIPDLIADDKPFVEELILMGFQVEPVIWDKCQDWECYEQIIVRSCWDYTQKYPLFLEVMEQIHSSSASLWNPLSIILDNVKKDYLIELARQGIYTVPTRLMTRDNYDSLSAVMLQENWDSIIVKPMISASGLNTFKVLQEQVESFNSRFKELLDNFHSVLIQPFIPQINTSGEWSIIYFNGEYSHAVLKSPAINDFRVQEEYGGNTVPAKPSSELLEQVERILDTITSPWLYARIDGILIDERFMLMELELVEPHLYMFADPQAPLRFARALKTYC